MGSKYNVRELHGTEQMHTDLELVRAHWAALDFDTYYDEARTPNGACTSGIADLTFVSGAPHHASTRQSASVR